jgi:antitoxin (DNA-binding transcriptional repressor) of toxin-antitoxin stability system
MRQVSLREFRTRGAKALEAVPRGETVLLSGQKGPAYFLVPAVGDIAAQDMDLRRAMARASLRESWRLAEKYPITDEEIEQEIQAARAERDVRTAQPVRTVRREERKKKIA